MLVTELLMDTLTSANAEVYFNLFGVFVSVLLIALLVNKSLLLALDSQHLGRWHKTLDVATFSTSLVFIAVLVISIWRILQGYIE